MADAELERLGKAMSDARLKVLLLRQQISLAMEEYRESLAELSAWHARQPRGGEEVNRG